MVSKKAKALERFLDQGRAKQVNVEKKGICERLTGPQKDPVRKIVSVGLERKNEDRMEEGTGERMLKRENRGTSRRQVQKRVPMVTTLGNKPPTFHTNCSGRANVEASLAGQAQIHKSLNMLAAEGVVLLHRLCLSFSWTPYA